MESKIENDGWDGPFISTELLPHRSFASVRN